MFIQKRLGRAEALSNPNHGLPHTTGPPCKLTWNPKAPRKEIVIWSFLQCKKHETRPHPSALRTLISRVRNRTANQRLATKCSCAFLAIINPCKLHWCLPEVGVSLDPRLPVNKQTTLAEHTHSSQSKNSRSPKVDLNNTE